MSMVNVKLDFEELKKIVHQLPREEQEKLLYELEPSLGVALREMEKEAIEEEKYGATISVQQIK